MPTVLDLPEELVEYVLLHVSSYGELQSCSQVCTLWHRLAIGAKSRLYKLFTRCDSLQWFLLNQPETGPARPTIAERCSHASCFHADTRSVCVFGGCTAAYTTFNDLWKFDLVSRTWNRLIPSGDYPTPKACATLVEYNKNLYLFGGWAKSSPNPIHQTAMFFNELHVYDPCNNSWTVVVDDGTAPHLAGHSATVLNDKMVIFGGSHGNGSSNVVWLFHFKTQIWSKPITSSVKPTPRYGQSQIMIDKSHMLIMGGCGGPNLIFSDIWLLTINAEGCQWEEVTVTNPQLSAPLLWSHPAVRIDKDKVIVLSKAQPTARDRSGSGSFRDMSSSQRNLGGTSIGGRNWTPPQGNLIPPRRRLISSRSLDEKNPPPSPKLDKRKTAELQRAQSIPTIIVGEIPKLVVTNNDHESDLDEDTPGPSGRCIAMAASSLLPNQATPVQPPLTQNQMGGIARGARHYRDRAQPSIKPNACNNRERQLEMLRRMEERLRCRANQPCSDVSNETGNASGGSSGSSSPKLTFRPQSPPPKSKHKRTSTFSMSRNPMQVYILDIDNAIQHKKVTWRVLERELDAPDDTILYSICAGWGELIMFGGMRSSTNPEQQGLNVTPFTHMITNETYILRPHIAL